MRGGIGPYCGKKLHPANDKRCIFRHPTKPWAQTFEHIRDDETICVLPSERFRSTRAAELEFLGTHKNGFANRYVIFRHAEPRRIGQPCTSESNARFCCG